MKRITDDVLSIALGTIRVSQYEDETLTGTMQLIKSGNTQRAARAMLRKQAKKAMHTILTITGDAPYKTRSGAAGSELATATNTGELTTCTWELKSSGLWEVKDVVMSDGDGEPIRYQSMLLTRDVRVVADVMFGSGDVVTFTDPAMSVGAVTQVDSHVPLVSMDGLAFPSLDSRLFSLTRPFLSTT